MSVTGLQTRHNCAAFASGDTDLDIYLRRQAKRDVAKRLVAVFVLLAPGGAVAGYYTLSPATLFLPDLLGDSARKPSRYPPMPAAKLSRLAVGQAFRGRGYGRYLLADALRRVQASPVASVAVVAEAPGQAGQAFYAREGFLAFPDSASRWFRPMADIAGITQQQPA